MKLKAQIKSIAAQISGEVIGIRRYLHQYPEVSFQEEQTATYIRKKLDEMDISWVPVATNGTLATISGKSDAGMVIALRADIDALALEERNDIEYCSRNSGVMHACGHDVHTAILLGVAKILKMMASCFDGTVKLIFQPAEEILPGGALAVIRDGVLNNPKVDLIIGEHVMPTLPVGKVGIRKGHFMASMDEISITVKGKGGHGAQPHQVVDPVVAASTAVVVLQQLIARKSNPSIPSVLSFGKFRADGTINIIPDDVLLEGTFRTMDEEWRKSALDEIRRMFCSVVEGLGCSCNINIRNGFPSLSNPFPIADAMEKIMVEYLGKEQVVMHDIWMAAEDFSYYAREINSFFYLLGVGEAGKEVPSLHSSLFNIDEDAIEVGMGTMTYLVLKQLVY